MRQIHRHTDRHSYRHSNRQTAREHTCACETGRTGRQNRPKIWRRKETVQIKRKQTCRKKDIGL